MTPANKGDVMELLKNQYADGQWFIERPVSKEQMKMFKDAGFLNPYYCNKRNLPDEDDVSDIDIYGYRYYLIYSQHRILSKTTGIMCDTKKGTFGDMLLEKDQSKFDYERE